MMLITDHYKQLQEELHESRPDYGMSDARFADFVINTADKINTRSILSYGAGKGSLQKAIPFPIQNYDPCVAEFAKRPEAADIVSCCDVLEHIEPECLDDVLLDLAELTKQILFVNVACRPAKKFLSDGRNAHLIQETPTWWLLKLLPLMDLVSFQAQTGEFTAILCPKKLPETPA